MEGSASRATNFMMSQQKSVFRGTPFVDDKSSPDYECNKEEEEMGSEDLCFDYQGNPSPVTFKNIANYTDNAIIILDEDSLYKVSEDNCDTFDCPPENRVICGGLYNKTDENNWTYARGQQAPESASRYRTKRITVQDKNSNKKTQFIYN